MALFFSIHSECRQVDFNKLRVDISVEEAEKLLKS